MSSTVICYSVVIQLFVWKVSPSYMPPYAARPYYPREARPLPREVKPYVVDSRYVTNYVNTPAYPKYAAPEPPNPMYRYETPVESVYPEIHPKPTLITPPVIEVPPKLPIIETNPPRTGGLDPDILNNLAIALQLLIINNLINNPLSESPDLVKPTNLLTELKGHHSPCIEYEYPYAMPSSKFLGSNNFGDDGLSLGDYGHSAPLSPRANMMLMSPYDAIARSASPDTTSSKRDFQNPYSSIIAADYNKDLFSMTDLF